MNLKFCYQLYFVGFVTLWKIEDYCLYGTEPKPPEGNYYILARNFLDISVYVNSCLLFIRRPT